MPSPPHLYATSCMIARCCAKIREMQLVALTKLLSASEALVRDDRAMLVKVTGNLSTAYRLFEL